MLSSFYVTIKFLRTLFQLFRVKIIYAGGIDYEESLQYKQSSDMEINLLDFKLTQYRTKHMGIGGCKSENSKDR